MDWETQVGFATLKFKVSYSKFETTILIYAY